MAKAGKDDDLRVVRVKFEHLEQIAEKLKNEKAEVSRRKDKKTDRTVDEWDSLWDDNGECLDESLLSELDEKLKISESVIKVPRQDFANVVGPEADDDEHGHLLEVFDFAPSLKSEDILLTFSEYRSQGLDITWVDDTHCLLIFPNRALAKQALREPIAFMKARPFSLASQKAKTKAELNGYYLNRPMCMKRPEKTAASARRLVAGALGIRISVPKETLEKEKQTLKEAKEKKMEKKRLQAEAVRAHCRRSRGKELMFFVLLASVLCLCTVLGIVRWKKRQPGASEAERNVVLDAEMKQVRFRQQLKMFFDARKWRQSKQTSLV
ncbi:coiled-coil domain-containing protein R3HCC1L-like [Oscarella lobularis]|uniref:coiled-coil domain-containing protein R3HCC1L-like n=1 Tax=Oscarella lobularis TaxID=121494 RepID=UPI0033139793